MALRHLYEWVKIQSNLEATDLICYLEEEKLLMQHGIRTRVISNAPNNGIGLWVPMKDYEIANALINGDIKTVIDTPKTFYHVFEDDLTFKNDKLYNNPYKNLFKFNQLRNYIIMGLGIVIVAVVYFIVNFL